MNCVPCMALNWSASGKLMSKKRPASASQKGALPASSITPRNSASVRVAEARAVQLDEQIAAARQQQSPAARAHLGVEEQAADLARSFEVGGQAQLPVAEGLAQLRARLGERADMVGIEGLLTMPTWPNTWQVPRISFSAWVFEHEDVEVVRLASSLVARERLFASGRACRPA